MARTPDDPTKAQVWVTKGLDDLDFEFYFPQGPKGDPGGFANFASLGNVNLNDMVSNGIFKQTNGAYSTLLNNYPAAGGIGTLFVLNSFDDTSRVEQRWSRMAGGGQFTWSSRQEWRRTKYDADGWTPWRCFTSQRVDQTAGRCIYTWDDLNQREQLIYGDTGMRNITSDQGWVDALTGAGVTLAGSGLNRIRRVNNVVELDWVIDKPASGNTVPAAAFPLGFRPAGLWNALGVTSSLTMVRAYHAGGTNALIYQSQVGQSNVTISLTYTTADPWPTTLPGVSAGTIPT
jgi:hypothetical protein